MSVDVNEGLVWRCEESFPSVSGAAESFIDSLIDELDRRGWSPSDQFAARLAVEEAMTNAFEHGNKWDEKKKAHLQVDLTDGRLFVAIRDEGKGFCASDVPDPSLEENIESPSGRGLFLIRNLMTKVWHNDCGNIIYMEKIPGANDAAKD